MTIRALVSDRQGSRLFPGTDPGGEPRGEEQIDEAHDEEKDTSASDNAP